MEVDLDGNWTLSVKPGNERQRVSDGIIEYVETKQNS